MKITNLSTDGAKFTNINSSYPAKMGFYGLNKGLVYNSSNNVACSNINSCDGNLNITAGIGHNISALNEFNLTEGVSREHSPLNITGTSTFTTESYNSKTYSIDSDILNELDNLTFITNSTSCPSTGDTIKIGGTDMSYTCSGNNVLVTLNNLVNGNNNLVFTYNGQSQGGGGTGGSGGDPLGNTDLILCNLTYNYIKNYSQTDYSYIDSIRGNYSWTETRRYLDNWQPFCSDAIKRTLKEEFVCDKLFYLIVSKPDYSLIEINTLRNQIVNDIQISNNLLLNYADNYETMCKYNKNLPFKREKVGNLTIVKNLTDCNLNTSLSLLGLNYDEISIPLGKIYINEKSCSAIANYRWFVKFERDAEGLFINGIKLGWLISIFIFVAILLIIKTQFKTKAIEKGLFKK